MDDAIDVREYNLIDLSRTKRESHETQGRRPSKTFVPKFASFRPREPVTGRDDRTSESGHRSPGDKSHAKTEHSKHRHRYRPTDEREGRHKDAGRQSTTPDIAVASLSHAKPLVDSFIVDRIGDPKNRVYGTLDRYATSVYYRIGAGSVIGAGPGLKIDRAASNEKCVVLSAQDGGGRHEKHPLQTNRGANSPVFRVKKNAVSNDDFIGARDFISLGSDLPTQKAHGDGDTTLSLSSPDDEQNHYKSVLGDSIPQDFNDPDLELAPETVLNDEERPGASNDQLRHKNAELTRRLDSEPDDIETWLQLIHNHDGLLGPRLTAAVRHGNADIKISMYEKAIRAVKTSESRQILMLELMEEGAKIWDNNKLVAQWRAILKNNPNFSGLWTNFLEFKQTTFAGFRFDGVQDVFFERLSVLQESMHRENDVLQQTQIYENQVFILLRMTLYMRESGFSENAFAAWQAQLEFEYLGPPDLQTDNAQSLKSLAEEKVSRFKDFWESEVPRIGEDGAQGWATFCQSGGLPPDPETMTADQLITGNNPFSMWIDKESQNSLLSRHPARTIDDGVENDPYRVVIFSDIRPFLINPPSLDCRHVPLEAFLSFCQLPPCRPKKDRGSQYKDGFLSNEALNLAEQDLMSSRTPDKSHEQGVGNVVVLSELPEHSLFDFPNLQFQLDSEILFAQKGSWFSAFNSWRSNTRSLKSPIDPIWVLNVLKGLLGSEVGDDLLAEYVLALELCISPETTRKTTRKLLKHRNSSLRLYNAYALIEYRLNNPNKGEETFITTINMSKNFEGIAGLDSILLWRAWTWELLNEGKNKDALFRLLTFADARVYPLEPQDFEEVAPNPAKILRTENGLTAFRDQALSLQSPEHAVLSMECLILLDYLKDTSTLSSALTAFSTNLAVLSAKSPNATSSEEILHQSLAHLLHHHATHTHSFKPSEIRACLAQSIAQFPSNTIFLSLYAWNETRFRIDDRVRAIVQDVVLGTVNNNGGSRQGQGQESVTSHFFAIHTELTRGVAFGSNDNAIRASFERAVESKSGAHCGGLWKIYFLFEHSRGNWKSATTVLYRGIRACPWIKELYLLPFEYLREGPGAMREAELKGMYDMMVEKELRVHVDLEELIERRGG